jgi:hypothetical protein
VVLLGIIEGDALLYMRSGWGKLSEAVEGLSQSIVGHQEKDGVLYMLSQAEELLSQLTRRL